MPRLLLRVLGTFSLSVDDSPVTAFKSDKGRALLAYLAVEADRSHRRERVAGLLWPDFPDRAALARLSDTLSNLRRILDDHGADGPFLTITPTTLQFSTGCDCTLDLREFERLTEPLTVGASAAAQLADFEAAASLYRGPFLEGFSLKDSADFEEWVLLKRERIAQRMAGALRRLAALYERRGEYEAALRHALRLVQMEPLDEENYRVSMRILAGAGNRSGALTVYENCRAVLAREFHVEPDAETVALRDAIRSGRFAAAVMYAADSSANTATEGRPVYAANKPQAASFAVHPAEHGQASGSETRQALVVREPELARLGRFLDRAVAGQGHVAFVTGEAGTGKSALMAEFTRRAMAADPDLLVARGSCNAFVGIGDPYLPFRDLLRALTGNLEARHGRSALSQDHDQRLHAALPDIAHVFLEQGPDLLGFFVPVAPLLARLEALAREGISGSQAAALRLAELARRQSMGPAAQAAPAAIFDQFGEVLQSIGERWPLLLVVNDLQWADSGSISLLFHLGRRLGNSRVLFVGSYRADDVDLGRDGGRHPLEAVVNELERELGDLRIPLPAAPGRAFVDALLDAEPNVLPEGFREALTCRTGGHPLFTAEMLRGLQERGDSVRDAQGRWAPGPALNWDELPSRIEAVLAERVGRLPAQQRDLLEIASVEGEEFTVEVTAAVQGLGEEEVGRWLSGPLRRLRMVIPTGFQRLPTRRLSRYRFTHYVLRQYLYSRLDPIDRMRLHEAVGTKLESVYGEQAPQIAVQLAWHFDQAGLGERAVDYLEQAGHQAMRLSSYQEAVRHFERGLALVATLPPSAERSRREFDLRLPLSSALIATHGWAAVERFAAAAEVAAKAGQRSSPVQAIQVLIMQASVLQARGEFAESIRVGEEALALSGAVNDRQSLMLSYGGLGITCYYAGSWPAARQHLTQALELYSKAEDRALLGVIGADPQAVMLGLLASTLWMLGYPDQARATVVTAVRVAEELQQTITHATVASHLLFLHALAGVPAGLVCDLNHLLQTSREREWPVIRTEAEVLQGWWTAHNGDAEAGIGQMKTALATWPVAGNVGRLPIGKTLLARICLAHGLTSEGLAAVDEMLTLCRQGIGRLVEPELQRLRGELLLAAVQSDEAEACFVRAIEAAREQSARAWELRASMSLARLWQRQGKPAEARELVSGVYARFSEGWDTPDLQEAASLLQGHGLMPDARSLPADAPPAA